MVRVSKDSASLKAYENLKRIAFADAKVAWRHVDAGLPSPICPRKSARNLLKAGFWAISLEDTVALKEIGLDHLLQVSEYVSPKLLSDLSRLAIPILSPSAENRTTVAAWQRITSVALRRAGRRRQAAALAEEAAAHLNNRADDLEPIYAALSLASTYTENHMFEKANDTLGQLSSKILSESPGLHCQETLERARMYRVLGDRERELYYANKALEYANDGHLHAHAKANCQGLMSQALVANGFLGKAYPLGLKSCLVLLMTKRDWPYFSASHGFQTSLDLYCSLPEVGRCATLITISQREWITRGSLSDRLRQNLVDALLQLYRFHLDHQASGEEIYNNPYLKYLPARSKVDDWFDEQQSKNDFVYR